MLLPERRFNFLAQCSHFDERQLGIERTQDLTHWANHQVRAPAGSNMQNEGVIESIDRWIVDGGRDWLAKGTVFCVADHADDFIVGSGNAASASEAEKSPDWILSGEVAPGENLVNDHFTRLGQIAVEPVEFAASEQMHSHSLEITRRDVIEAGVQKVVGRDASAGGRESSLHASAAHQAARCDTG